MKCQIYKGGRGSKIPSVKRSSWQELHSLRRLLTDWSQPMGALRQLGGSIKILQCEKLVIYLSDIIIPKIFPYQWEGLNKGSTHLVYCLQFCLEKPLSRQSEDLTMRCTLENLVENITTVKKKALSSGRTRSRDMICLLLTNDPVVTTCKAPYLQVLKAPLLPFTFYLLPFTCIFL